MKQWPLHRRTHAQKNCINVLNFFSAAMPKVLPDMQNKIRGCSVVLRMWPYSNNKSGHGISHLHSLFTYEVHILSSNSRNSKDSCWKPHAAGQQCTEAGDNVMYTHRQEPINQILLESQKLWALHISCAFLKESRLCFACDHFFRIFFLSFSNRISQRQLTSS